MGEEVSLRAEVKMVGEDERSPSRIWMFEERLERARADGDCALRVTARMLKDGGEGEERRISIAARPCLPVAPVMRRVFGCAIVEE